MLAKDCMAEFKGSRNIEVYPISAHDIEVCRIADLVYKHIGDSWTMLQCLALVWDVLDNYHPTVEWLEEQGPTNGADLDITRVVLKAQIGPRTEQVTGFLNKRGEMNEHDSAMYRRSMLSTLGREFTNWMAQG